MGSSPVTLSWQHNGSWGVNCAGNNNRFKVYMKAGNCNNMPQVCDVDGGTKNCQANVTDGQNYCWKVVATNGNSSTEASSGNSSFSVVFHAGGWFQVQDTDIGNPGNLISRIPPQCTGNQCTPEFNLQGGGGFPGVPAYGGSAADFGSGSVSGEGWLANTGYSGRRYDYRFFARNIRSDATQITSSQINGGDLVSMGSPDRVQFATREGDLTINGTANLGNRKLVLFVSGDLNIEDRITLDDGEGFFAAIVGGNIDIDPGVSHPNNPALEGLFLADGTISTGTQNPAPDNRLYVRGALVGWSGVNLERDLDPTKTSGANNETPAEFIEYAPDLILTFPRELLREGLVWREVAP